MNISSPLCLLLASVVSYLVGALASAALASHERFAIRFAGCAGVVGGGLGLLASAPVLLSGQILKYAMAGPFPFAHFVVRFDPLAALMVFVISLLALICAIYSFAYVREYAGRGAWAMGFFMNLFIAAMVTLVVVDNAFYFLIFFELMSLASYFLVIFDQDEEAVNAGFLYFFIAHAGSVLIMVAFFILYSYSGSLDFDSFRGTHLPPFYASLAFLLAFFGFGAKAGIVPLHGWLPRAHPAAPSHASALMSGVMVKIGVFGIVKVGIDLLGGTTMWWGLVVLGFGAVSAVLGVLYALAENDIKRLLAYSTVENVGIILMGVGVGMVGIATHHPVIAALGLLAGFYHLLNHTLFKGLLFLGAGSVLFRMHTKDMRKMGGLGRRMPYTAVCFLIGAMAISALPPLNGFVSEWFTYQSLFSMSQNTDMVLRLAGPVVMVMLALAGALAVMCFVKAYGITFSALPRSKQAEQAKEVPWPMLAAMISLALLCIVFGLASPLVSRVMAGVAGSLMNTATLPVAQGFVVFPASDQAMLSTPLMAILLISIPLLPLIIISVLKGGRVARQHGVDAWACGYTQESEMTVSSSGFVQPIRVMFSSLYDLRVWLDLSGVYRSSLQWVISAMTRFEPVFETRIVSPTIRSAQWVGRWVQWLQHGDFRIYCLYVVVALVTLLLFVAL